MSVNLSKSGNIYTIQDGSANIVLDVTNKYINYTGTAMTSSTTNPSSNSLFSYSTEAVDFAGNEITLDVYDFRGNTIVFGGGGITLEGLINSANNLDRSVSIKNLNLLVTVDYTAATGYIFTDFTAGNTLITFMENCNLVVNIDSAILIPGLMGNDVANCLIDGCSLSSSGSEIPNITINKGSICGENCGFADGIETVVIIQNCYSTVDMNSISTGGICGNNCGRTTNTGTSSVLIERCYSTGVTGTGGGGITGSNCGSVIAGTGNTCDVSIISCYSTGTISGNLSGGICGTLSNLAIVDSVSNLTITTCYTNGAVEGTDAGGIVGYRCNRAIGATAFSNMFITSCYSLGEVTGTDAAGICGGEFATLATSGNLTAEITCCYTLGGLGLDGGFAQGELLGSLSVPANIVSVNNSFSFIMLGVGTDGRISIDDMQENCEGYEPRCISTPGGETALVLIVFLDNDWRNDENCLDLFAPGIGDHSCPLDITYYPNGDKAEWPVTEPDTTIEFPCKNNLQLTRYCDSLGEWEDVESFNCDDIVVTIVVTIVIVGFFLFIFVMFVIGTEGMSARGV